MMNRSRAKSSNDKPRVERFAITPITMFFSLASSESAAWRRAAIAASRWPSVKATHAAAASF
jgi:hypothetical protein